MDLPLQSILMFQSWPKVSINRNHTETQLFSKYFSTVKKNDIKHHMSNNFDEEEPKSKKEANTFRSKGNNCFKIMEFNAALEMYNISLARAPKDSTEYGLALANRSAVLYDIKKYKECLVDIDRVLKSKYPEELLHKVYLRQSRCFIKLNQIPESKKSLEKIEEFLEDKENITETQMDLIKQNIKILKTEIEEKLEQLPVTVEGKNGFEFPAPVLRDGENPKFLNASNAVNFGHTSPTQRSVVAAKDIAKGDILFIEKPYAFTALSRPGHRFTTCAFCFDFSLNCVPCPTCTKVFYCCNECQSAAWDLNHKWQCFNERHQIITDVRQKLGMSILLKASQEHFETNIEDISVYGNKENNHPFMNKLLTHLTIVPEFVLGYNIKAAVWIVMYLKCFTDFFDWLYAQPNHPGNTKEDLFNFVGGYLVKYMLQISCNMNVIHEARIHFDQDKSASINYQGLGLGIYLSSALINHSCLPNAGYSFQGNLKIVRAFTDIKQGTEVRVNYIGEGNEVETKERQSRLGKYMFQCSCLKCTKPNYDKIYDPYLCTRCGGNAYPHRGRAAIKCTSCNLVFSRNRFNKRIENKILEKLIIFDITGDISHKNALYGLIKKTYHKDSTTFIAYYRSCLKHYGRNGEMVKCLETIKSLTDTTENIFGNSTNHYIISMIQATYLVVNYRNILKKKNSILHERFETEAKAYLKKTVDGLQFFVSPKNIAKFIESINELLESGEVKDYDDDDDDDYNFEDSDSDSDCVLDHFRELCSFLN